MQPGCAVQTSFYGITADDNTQLILVNAYTDDDRYDMAAEMSAGQPKWDLSEQLRSCSIASTEATRLRSANELLWYHRRL